MNSQFKKGIIEMCVIAVIARQDLYGFAVIETIAKDIDVNENTIYPILRRLTVQGYFDTYMEATGIGAPRKYYRITEIGKAKMTEYAAEWSKFLRGVLKILGGNA
ncbi:MAG: PadR family transcriptional regulator [bacterium]